MVTVILLLIGMIVTKGTDRSITNLTGQIHIAIAELIHKQQFDLAILAAYLA